jgi:hypothetical protein
MLSIIGLLALPWWIGLKQEDPRFSPYRKEIPSLVISLNFHTKNNNLISAELEKGIIDNLHTPADNVSHNLIY